MFKYYIDILNRKLLKYKDYPIAIYGSGNHTKILLDNILYKENIIGIIDRNNIGDCIFGYKIFEIDQLKNNIKAIIISSDVYQDIIYDRIKYLEKLGIELIKIYETDEEIINKWKDNQNVYERNTILFYPNYDWQLNNQIFNENDMLNNINKNLFKRLSEQMLIKGYTLKTLDNGNMKTAKWIIFNNINKETNIFLNYCLENNINNLILFIWEPEVVQREIYNKELHKYFKYVFTWMDDLVDNKKYFKFWYTK